jgi:hypothetical protein
MQRTNIGVVDNHLVSVGASDMDRKRFDRYPLRDVAFAVENLNVA